MLIGINKKSEIKQVGTITDHELSQIDIDNQMFFKNQDDAMILCYCYKTNDNGVEVYHQSKEKFAEWQNLKLQQENKLLKSQLVLQNTAIDEIFIMLPTLGV